MKFSDNPQFKGYLAGKKQDIYQRTNDGVQETEPFQRLLSILAQCRRKVEEQDFRLILISKEDLSKLCADADIKAMTLFRHATFLTNRTVLVDSELKIQNNNNDPFPDGDNDARHYFASLATDDMVVFHVAPNATVNFFIDGNDYGDGIFYTRDTLTRYEELRTIEQIKEVLDDYRIKLTLRDTYLKFFVTKAGLRALRTLTSPSVNERTFLENNKHLLNNKPEELFREDIRNYIKEHMKIIVTREVTMENLDRLDIELTDEEGKDLYFIEIKWVGESIGPNGDKIVTKFNAQPRINPDAVRQVISYIDELLKEDKNVKLGYLAVFDARKDDLEDTGTGISEDDVPENLRQHFHRFVKLPDFRVKNINPR